MYARKRALPPDIHFFEKIGHFGVPYLYACATDSYEISLFTKLSMMN